MGVNISVKKILSVISVCILASFSFPGRQTYAVETDKNDRLNYNQHNPVAGDVNADGELSILDVVLMQKWLIAVPDTELADWKAGDLCEDDKLDVFDLCLMKRALIQTMTHNPLDLLIGMNYEDAVRNAYISKSEYNYQISGNLKSTIENKMGRLLDYSIDRFYLVNNEKLGLNSDTKYLYNADTMDIYPINEETKMNCATWYWKGSKAALYGIDDDEEKQNEFLDAMEFYDITEIYYSIGANKLVKSKDMVETFVKNAYARNMKVYLLTGENTWLYEDSYQTAIYNIFDKVEEYNSLVDYDSRLAGVSYDVEVWTNSEFNWKNNNEARYQQVKFIETAQKYAESKNLSVSYCLPFWIVQYEYTDNDGVTRNVYDSITQTANDTILMVYRDSVGEVERLVTEVQNNAENSVFYYIEKNDCNLEIAMEANESSEGNYVTFYEEEKENPGYVNTAITTIKSDLEAYKYRTTFAIHHAIALYEYIKNGETL
ncbi:MAG: dockerin type I repeat-containing protein [Ruminococcus sp.]|nr:dockerin type I repeat-containing protein [Ruminococcus sp.]